MTGKYFNVSDQEKYQLSHGRLYHLLLIYDFHFDESYLFYEKKMCIYHDRT